jgi:uncharacterized lipoprotein YddW (UPF0748 family)
MIRRGLAALLLLALAFATPAEAQELRALWVDAFHEGIRSPREADDLVATAKRANLNTLIVQVRRRGDALYSKGIEPPLDDPAYDPAFDALAYIVDAGHRGGLKVHAWINAMPVWRDEAAPRDPRHVFNRHGLTATGEGNWLTSAPDGTQKFPVGYFLDPGHPAAADYLAQIYLDVVRNYAVDGIHFDYVRYPETTAVLSRGSAVGYNPVSIARFQRATGRTDIPLPGDEAWMTWRRDQVTNLVRRVSIEAKALNPKIVISAAAIPWGAPPTNEIDFVDVAPMQRIFQDWHGWLQAGWLDLAVPMNYATETDARVRGWFDGWIRWEKRHAHGRHIATGIGAYRNTAVNTLAQVARARAADEGHAVAGVSLYSYAVTGVPAPGAGVDRLAFLVDGAAGARGPFTDPSSAPAMPWIERPERGWLGGVVRGTASGDHDGVVVKVKRRRFWPFARETRVRADGNGYYGLANVKAGRYEVSTTIAGAKRKAVVVVAAGRVARADL